MEEIENIKNELEEIKTARDNIKTALQNEGETVTNDIRTYADTIPNVNKVKTVNSVEADTNKNIQLDASKINLDDTVETKQTVKEVIEDMNTKVLVSDTMSKNVFIAKGNKEAYDCIGMEIWEHTLDGETRMRNHNASRIYSSSGSIKIQGMHGGVTDINISVEPENVVFDPQESGLTSTKIAPAIRELKGNIDNITVPEYSVKETTVTEGYSKTYSLTKDGAEVGVKINIPKDLVINRGSVKVVATADTPYDGAVVGDKYLDIELNDPTQDHIYIPVKELVDVYTAGDGIEISADNVIKSKNSNLINGSAEGSLKSIGTVISGSSPDGIHSFAEGYNTKAKGDRAHAEGNTTKSLGENSHAEGYNTTADGNNSHAEGSSTLAKGINAHTEGSNTVANGANQHVQGRYNIEDTNNRYAHIVGNGSSNTARSNAHTVAWDGTGWFQGNVKVGGTGQDDTNAKNLATEDYVNNELEPVKTDICLIQNTVGGIFYWDGKSSSDNPDNIQLWNNILTKHLEQDVLIYTTAITGSRGGVAVLPKNKVNLSTDGQKNIDIGFIDVYSSKNSDVTYLSGKEIRITLTLVNRKVTVINKFNDISYTLGQYLETNYNYPTPYTPKYDGSPATKKYVDDKYNALSVIEIVSADKEPGYTFSFGKLCDSVMVFLNGEKLIAQKSSSQTIEEYSYIENKTDNKITSVTFTNDFTITTGDRIEAILINPSDIPTASEISNGGEEYYDTKL